MQFSDLKIIKPLLNALDEMGLETPTTIQEKAFSIIMSGKDVCGIAQTGTGKTLAYLLPCIQMLEFTPTRFPQMLIIVPTRELVIQVVAMAKKLCEFRNFEVAGVYGGVNMKPQADTIMNGLDILVATPGRLYDLMQDGILNTKMIRKFVIDEVDEMLDLGFRPQLTRIMNSLPTRRQNLLFSATITADVDDLLDDYFTVPVRVEAAPAGAPLANINQTAIETPNFFTKLNILRHLLQTDAEMDKVIVFMSSKKMADLLFEKINEDFREQIGVIHSNKDQGNRFNTVAKLKDGTYRIVIATDIVARGIDIDNVSHVFNFDLPEVAEYYIHRIGRTGRALRKGEAISFVLPSDTENKKQIEELMQMKIPMAPIPNEELISTELLHTEVPKIVHREIQIKIPKRENVGTAFHEKKEKNKKDPSQRVTHQEKMDKKYKKPKTRGAKGKRK